LGSFGSAHLGGRLNETSKLSKPIEGKLNIDSSRLYPPHSSKQGD
jgi:hypothetical protein